MSDDSYKDCLQLQSISWEISIENTEDCFFNIRIQIGNNIIVEDLIDETSKKLPLKDKIHYFSDRSLNQKMQVEISDLQENVFGEVKIIDLLEFQNLGLHNRELVFRQGQIEQIVLIINYNFKSQSNQSNLNTDPKSNVNQSTISKKDDAYQLQELVQQNSTSKVLPNQTPTGENENINSNNNSSSVGANQNSQILSEQGDQNNDQKLKNQVKGNQDIRSQNGEPQKKITSSNGNQQQDGRFETTSGLKSSKNQETSHKKQEIQNGKNTDTKNNNNESVSPKQKVSIKTPESQDFLPGRDSDQKNSAMKNESRLSMKTTVSQYQNDSDDGMSLYKSVVLEQVEREAEHQFRRSQVRNKSQMRNQSLAVSNVLSLTPSKKRLLELYMSRKASQQSNRGESSVGARSSSVKFPGINSQRSASTLALGPQQPYYKKQIILLPKIREPIEVKKYTRDYKDYIYGYGMSNIHSATSLRHSVPTFSFSRCERFPDQKFIGFDSLSFTPHSDFIEQQTYRYQMEKSKKGLNLGLTGAYIGKGQRTQWEQTTKNNPGPGSYLGSSNIQSYLRRFNNPYNY